jgi:hypothetical protein
VVWVHGGPTGHGLIGPLPGYETVYEERAPVGHVTAQTGITPAPYRS